MIGTWPRVTPERHSAAGALAKSSAAVVGPGPERPPDPTKGTCRCNAPPQVTGHGLSRVHGHGGLGGFLTWRERRKKARESSARPLKGWAKARPDFAQEGEATEVSEA